MVLVEKSTAAAKIAAQNAKLVLSAFSPEVQPKISVQTTGAASFLTVCELRAGLVFMDPPYDLPEEDLAENLRQIARITAVDALVVVERSARSPEPAWPEGLQDARKKTYGETAVWTAVRSS